MKLLRFDSVGGAAGNMILAAMLDAGADLDAIHACLQTLPLDGYRLERASVLRNGVSGTTLTVHLTDHQEHPHQEHPHPNHPDHEHSHHEHPAHRGLAEVETIIRAGRLPPTVRDLSLAVFRRLAEAEARIHGTTPDNIHFHEVGAVDAIVDIVGCCAALHTLDITAVFVGPLPIGQGTTVCAHGVIPIPAPAVARMLEGHPLEPTTETQELVTPTGAAILTTWRDLLPMPSPMPALHFVATGYGFGSRHLRSRANLLRAGILESNPDDTHGDLCLVLETQIDDMSPELIGALTQQLLGLGAHDVFTSAIQMKKQRPGTLLTVLCTPAQRATMVATLFRESTTFGIREHLTTRTVLKRRLQEVQTPYGPLRVKIGTWQGTDITIAPEYEDCRARAEAAGIPLRQVFDAARQAAAQR